MMMPANFSVIAENEMTYVVGGAFSFSKLGANAVTIVGNSYLADVIGTVLGTMFSGSWGSGFSLSDNMSNQFFSGKNAFNKVLSAVGIGAAVYNLGTTATGNLANSANKAKLEGDNRKHNHWFGTSGLFGSDGHEHPYTVEAQG